jgi:imidazolonepropionase-like amidohydrolase
MAWLLVAAAGASLAGAETPGAPCDRSPLAVTNAALWNEGSPQKGREILIENGLIAAIGPAGGVTRPAGSRVLDARGAWLLPGLIDSHVHFGRAGIVPPELLPQPNPGAWGTTTGRQTLASGVTTVRVHLSDFEKGPAWARAAEDDCNPSPRIELGGNGLMGGGALDAPMLPGVKGAEEARKKVAANARAGARWLPLHEVQRFTPEELAAIAEEARRLRLRVMAGGESVEEALAGLDAGARSLEYIDKSSARSYPDALIEALRRNGTFPVVPIGFYSRYVTYRKDPGKTQDPVHFRFETPAVATALAAYAKERFEKPPADEQSMVDNFAAYREKFRQLRTAGLLVVVGSDSGSQGQFHADAIWWELRSWRDNGASVADLLTAATRRPASMLGLSDRGAIRVGARGDFVLYDRDLWKGELDLTGVRAVGKGGVLFVREGRWVGPVWRTTGA